EDKVILYEKLLEEILGTSEKNTQNVDIMGNPMPTEKGKEKNYSIKQDAEYIYASFLYDYNIDLIDVQGKLHWYKFKVLLQGLSDDSIFGRVIGIRTTELPKKGKEREQMKKLKEAYKLKESD